MKTRFTAVVLAVLASCCTAAELPVVVRNVPASRIPKEARDQSAQATGTPRGLGPWSSFLTSATQVNIRYYSKHWATDDRQAEQRLSKVLHNGRYTVYDRIVWAQALDVPSVEGTVRYRNGREGRFMMWGTVACFQDAEQTWRFVAAGPDSHMKRQPKPVSGFSIQGEVNKPGEYELTGSIPYLKALRMAGGYTTDADANVTIKRGDAQIVKGMRTPKSRVEPSTAETFLIQPGDIIVVHKKDRVYVDGSSGDEHPLVCGPGRDFPSGRELAFKRLESGDLVHAVFPKEVTAPKNIEGKFILHGRFQRIQKMANYKMKKPSEDYRYFVVSSWEPLAGRMGVAGEPRPQPDDKLGGLVRELEAAHENHKHQVMWKIAGLDTPPAMRYLCALVRDASQPLVRRENALTPLGPRVCACPEIETTLFQLLDDKGLGPAAASYLARHGSQRILQKLHSSWPADSPPRWAHAAAAGLIPKLGDEKISRATTESDFPRSRNTTSPGGIWSWTDRRFRQAPYMNRPRTPKKVVRSVSILYLTVRKSPGGLTDGTTDSQGSRTRRSGDSKWPDSSSQFMMATRVGSPLSKRQRCLWTKAWPSGFSLRTVHACTGDGAASNNVKESARVPE